MTKEFKTNENLIDLLNSRGVITDERTVTALERESYYAIINGYKGPYLDYTTMQKTSDDVYLPGTRFEWIYDLFLFDRELRFITFKYLTKAEAIMKSAVVYAFCLRNPEPAAYLDKTKYTEAKNMLVPKSFAGNKAKLHSGNMKKLITTLTNKSGRNSERAFVSHYAKNHGSVPLWVLANDLTFGNMHHFFQLQKTGVQNDACKTISKYSFEALVKHRRLGPQELLRAFEVLVGFRNLCAHDERLYCHRLKGGDGYVDMCKMLCRVLPKEDIGDFSKEIDELFRKYNERLQNVTISSLMRDMGFPA